MLAPHATRLDHGRHPRCHEYSNCRAEARRGGARRKNHVMPCRAAHRCAKHPTAGSLTEHFGSAFSWRRLLLPVNGRRRPPRPVLADQNISRAQGTELASTPSFFSKRPKPHQADSHARRSRFLAGGAARNMCQAYCRRRGGPPARAEEHTYRRRSAIAAIQERVCSANDPSLGPAAAHPTRQHRQVPRKASPAHPPHCGLPLPSRYGDPPDRTDGSPPRQPLPTPLATSARRPRTATWTSTRTVSLAGRSSSRTRPAARPRARRSGALSRRCSATSPRAACACRSGAPAGSRRARPLESATGTPSTAHRAAPTRARAPHCATPS